MNIYTVIRKGEGHPVFCEDFLFHTSIGNNFGLYMVSDGCSSGIHAHFSSALNGKIIQKISREMLEGKILQANPDLNASELLRFILKSFMKELSLVKEQLLLEENELLATLLLMVYDFQKQQAVIIALGDGVIAIDGEIHQIDQNNRPDYPAYSLEMDFDQWFGEQKNIFLVQHPKEISISSDGVETFRSITGDTSNGLNPIQYLLTDTTFENNAQMLSRKMNILNTQHGYLPYDDVSIIRVKF